MTDKRNSLYFYSFTILSIERNLFPFFSLSRCTLLLHLQVFSLALSVYKKFSLSPGWVGSVLCAVCCVLLNVKEENCDVVVMHNVKQVQEGFQHPWGHPHAQRTFRSPSRARDEYSYSITKPTEQPSALLSATAPELTISLTKYEFL